MLRGAVAGVGARGAARAQVGGASGAQPPGCQATANGGLTVGEGEANA